MATQKTAIYSELSAALERVLASIATKKATMLEEVAHMQSEVNKKQADIESQLAILDKETILVRAKLEAILTGSDDKSQQERLQNEANSAISTLSSLV